MDGFGFVLFRIPGRTDGRPDLDSFLGCPTLGAQLLEGAQGAQKLGTKAMAPVPSIRPIFNDFPSFHRPITLLVTTSTARFDENIDESL